MRGPFTTLLLLVGIGIGLLSERGAAQDVPSEPSKVNTADKPTGKSPRVVEAKPEVFHLKDKDGRLVPYPGYTIEDFEELYKLKSKIEVLRLPPRHVIAKVAVAGRTTKDLAELTAEFTVQTQDQKWVRVPLGFSRAVLRRPISYKGDGEHLIEFALGDGYVCWIKAGQGKTHTLTMDLLAPLVHKGEETSLEIDGPQNAAVSTMTLRLPSDMQIVEDNMTRVRVESIRTGGTDTKDLPKGMKELTLLGLSRGFHLAWRKDSPVKEQQAVLRSECEILVEIEDSTIRSTAFLKVINLRGVLTPFSVRLPQGDYLPAQDLPGVSVTLRPDGISAILDIRPKSKTARMLEIELTVERKRDIDKPFETVTYAGFEVIGARQTSGIIAFRADRYWRVQWLRTVALRSTGELPERLIPDPQSHLAGFEYNRQPYRLSFRPERQKAEVSATPRYLVSVSDDRLQLETKIEYEVRGARVSTFHVLLPNWTIDKVIATGFTVKSIDYEDLPRDPNSRLNRIDLERVDPLSLVERAAEMVATNRKMIIKTAQPVGKRAEVTIIAHRTVHQPGQISLALPVPACRIVRLGTRCYIHSADDVMFQPQVLLGLEAGRPMATADRPDFEGSFTTLHSEWKRDLLVFQSDLKSDIEGLAGDLRVLEQDVAVRIVNRVDFQELPVSGRDDPMVVRSQQQTLSYNVRYSAIGELLIRVPTEIANSIRASILIKNQNQKLQVVRKSRENGPTLNEGRTPESEGVVLMKIVLDSPRIGEFNIRIDYPADRQSTRQNANKKWPMHWVAPVDFRLIDTQLQMVSDPSIDVELSFGDARFETSEISRVAQQADSAWDFAKLAKGARSRLQQTMSLGPNSPLVMAVSVSMAPRTTIVDLVWVQTQIIGAQVRHRIVYRFSSNARHLAISFPEEIAIEHIEYQLHQHDRDPRDSTSDSKASPKLRLMRDAQGQPLPIKLLPDFAQKNYTLELSCLVRPDFATSSKSRFELPSLAEGIRVKRTLWQLVVSQNYHLIDGPDRFVSESIGGWRPMSQDNESGMLYYRESQSRYSQRELEDWLGASHEGDLPVGSNRYMFSTLGEVRTLEVTTMRRSAILLIISGAVLVLGLLLVYVRLARHPVALLTGTAALVFLSFLYPQAALLVAQAGILGVALAIVAAMLQRVVRRRRQTESILANGKGSSVLYGSTTKTHPWLGDLNTPVSTISAPAELGRSPSE